MSEEDVVDLAMDHPQLDLIFQTTLLLPQRPRGADSSHEAEEGGNFHTEAAAEDEHHWKTVICFDEKDRRRHHVGTPEIFHEKSASQNVGSDSIAVTRSADLRNGLTESVNEKPTASDGINLRQD